MKIVKKYSFTNNKLIWRLLPSGDKLLIEERDEKDKQVYFSCLSIESGKKIMDGYQLDEKFWVGIEAFENDRIYFHKFVKPDMPVHIGITAFSLGQKKILWTRNDFVFLFLKEVHLVAFRQNFETRDYFLIDAENGNVLKEYGDDATELNQLREKSIDEQYEKYKSYSFPETYIPGKLNPGAEKIIEKIKSNKLVSGSVDFIEKGEYLYISYHIIDNNAKLENIFNLIDINSEKINLEVLLNQGIISFIPDSFFVKDDLLFLIKNKTELIVYSIG